MKKRILLTVLIFAFLLPQMAIPAAQAAEVATPTASKVLVNGKSISFDAYLINGNNYFKLRDLAYIFNGTEKQFDVGWDSGKNAITLTSGKRYTAVGGEMATTAAKANRTPVPSTSKIYLDGKEMNFVAYNIDGNNYFKLRDVMEALGVYVGWDGGTNTITLDTKNTSVKYVDGRNFSDGVAWAKTDKGIWHCLDKTGKIIFQLNEGEYPSSDFFHGVAVVSSVTSGYELIDKNNKVVSSREFGEYDNIIGIIPDLGMTVVRKNIVSFAVTETQTGFIDNQGNWKINLTNNSILNDGSPGYNYFLDIIYPEIDHPKDYLGEGYIKYYRGVYNIISGNSFKIPDLDMKSDRFARTWTLSEGYELRSMENNQGVFLAYAIEGFGTSGMGGVYSINSSGNTKQIITISYRGIERVVYLSASVGKYSDGLFYYANYKDEDNKNGFYDINGNLAIDLSSYNLFSVDDRETFNSNNIEFTDGYCLLPVKNPQGIRFFTVIDKNGNIMFEPKLFPTQISSINCGLIVLNYGPRYNENYSVINISGEIVIDLGNVTKVSDFNEDIAMVTDGGEIYYIDKTGKRLF